MLSGPVVVCSIGIVLNFLIQLFLNGLILISPCASPWMDGYGDDCVASNGLMLLQYFACSAILVVAGLAGSLLLFKAKSREKASFVVCGAVLFGAFVQFVNMIMYL